MSAPPPPPPHGEAPKSSGLPPGKYDIFVIPEHSAGSGFLYLPSLKPNVNSFAAGFASALILVALFQSMVPAFRAWWESFQGLGNMSLLLLIMGVGFGAWAFGRTQNDGSPSANSQSGAREDGADAGRKGFGNASAGKNPSSGSSAHSPPPPQPPGRSPPPPPPPPPRHDDRQKHSWQRPSPQQGASADQSPKSSWEKAREEMRKKEELRRAKEEEQKRREEAARKLAELRAKEAKERQEREVKEREQAEQKRRKEQDEKRRSEAAARTGSAYAFSRVGERTSMWPDGRPSASSPSASPAGSGRPPAPTAKTFLGTDEDAYSYRPYDDHGKKSRKLSASSNGGSEASWSPSQTTTRTTPPPSARGPYATKDPDKIVISAVYLFMSQTAKTPASQLVSGIGSVTDGLILRVTTEGLFIDDDVRGVPQREWDVKAWTLKQVEVRTDRFLYRDARRS